MNVVQAMWECQGSASINFEPIISFYIDFLPLMTNENLFNHPQKTPFPPFPGNELKCLTTCKALLCILSPFVQFVCDFYHRNHNEPLVEITIFLSTFLRFFSIWLCGSVSSFPKSTVQSTVSIPLVWDNSDSSFSGHCCTLGLWAFIALG